MSLIQHLVQKEIELITAVLNHPAGFDLDLFGGLLLVRSTDQTTFEVEWNLCLIDKDQNEIKGYLSFTTAEEAAKCFVQKRHEFRLGIDFECEDNHE